MNQQPASASSTRSVFSFSHFEGPLELLLYLIQKDEIDICDIFLKEATCQFFENNQSHLQIDEGADFLGIVSSLLLIKSRKLLPHDNHESVIEDEENVRLNLIHHLLEYCRFKEMATELSERESRERVFFPRGMSEETKPKKSGLEELALPELVGILQDVLQRSSKSILIIKEEEWQVEDMIVLIQKKLEVEQKIDFFDLFTPQKSKGELIVLFLALLEMMKHQQLRVVKKEEGILIELY